MKKTGGIICAFIAILLLCACANTKSNENGISNPMTEYGSLQDLGNACGVNINVGIVGVTDERYYCIDAGDMKIAEYEFKLDGTDFRLRAAQNLADDISGFYVGGKPVFEALSPARPGESTNLTGSDFKASRWYVNDVQYVLIAHDNGKFDAGIFATLSAQLEECTAVSGN